MISFDTLSLALAVLGVLMLGLSVLKTEYSAGLYKVGFVFLVVGVVIYVLLLLLG